MILNDVNKAAYEAQDLPLVAVGWVTRPAYAPPARPNTATFTYLTASLSCAMVAAIAAAV